MKNRTLENCCVSERWGLTTQYVCEIVVNHPLDAQNCFSHCEFYQRKNLANAQCRHLVKPCVCKSSPATKEREIENAIEEL